MPMVNGQTGSCLLRENFYETRCSRSSSGLVMSGEKIPASPANRQPGGFPEWERQNPGSFLVCKGFYSSLARVKCHSHNPSVSAVGSSGVMMDS